MNFRIDKKKLASIIKDEVVKELKLRPFYALPASENPVKDEETMWQGILVEKISEMLEKALAFGSFYSVEESDDPNMSGKILVGPSAPAPVHIAEGRKE